MPKVDVIVVNYNGRHFLASCLGALRKQTLRDYETIVVDNGSWDDSVEFVRASHPEVRVLALSDNFGFCGGNNRGIEATASPYVAFLNNDTEPSPEWLQSSVEVLDNDPQVGFCASKMIQIADRKTIDSAGDIFYTHGVGGKRGQGKSAELFSNQERVFGACAGAAMYRRAVLDEIGLFDEDLFAYDEDLDLSFRAQLYGYQCQFVPEAVVYHHVGGSFGTVSPRSILLARRNMFEVLLKNMPARLLVRYSPLILLYYLIGDVYVSLHGNVQSVVLARFENLCRIWRTLGKRRQIQRNRRVSIGDIESRLTRGIWTNLIRVSNRKLPMRTGTITSGDQRRGRWVP